MGELATVFAIGRATAYRYLLIDPTAVVLALRRELVDRKEFPSAHHPHSPPRGQPAVFMLSVKVIAATPR